MPEPIPFVVGVTGTDDIPGGARGKLVVEVRRVLLRFWPAGLDPVPTPDGQPAQPGPADEWPRAWATPVVILSTGATAADTLVADAARALDDEYRARRKAPAGGPEWWYRVVNARAFPPAAASDAEVFVPLDSDARLSPAELEAALAADRADGPVTPWDPPHDPAFRRKLRERAAGEYVAAHSNLMLVLDDTDPRAGETPDAVVVGVVEELTRAGDVTDQARLAATPPPPEGGTKYRSVSVAGAPAETAAAAALRAKRQGILPGLIRAEVAFTWADAGPVVHLYVPAAAADLTQAGRRTVLYPVDTRDDEGDVADTDKRWAEKAGELFASILGELDRYNAAAARSSADTEKTAAGETERMVGRLPAAELDRAALVRLGRERRRAANLANGDTTTWDRTLGLIFWLTLVAALALHFAVHWHGPGEHPPAAPGEHHVDGETRLRIVLGWLAVGAVGLGVVVYLAYKWSGWEKRRYDSRALAEALRVQVYWSAAGLDRSVPANYLQRQRTEMGWVRRAVTALAAPYTRWRGAFDALGPKEQLGLLKTIVVKWVRWDELLAGPPSDGKPRTDNEKAKAREAAQAGYMERKAKELHHAEEFWRRLGFDLALVAVVQVCIWVAQLGDKDSCRAEWFPGAWLFALVVGAGFLALWGFGFAHAVYACREDEKAWGWRHLGAGLAWCRNNQLKWRPLRRVLAWCGDPHTPVKPDVPKRKKTACLGWLWRGVWSSLVVWHSARCGFAWARGRCHYDCRRHDGWHTWVRYGVWGVQIAAAVALITLVTGGLCVLCDSGGGWVPDAEHLWVLSFGSFLIAGGLSIAWPERNYMAELRHQYYAMAAMYQAAGRRLLGHLLAAEAYLNANDLDGFRGRVKAVQALLYQVGQQALDENAEWVVLHRARPLEPLMAA